jgi:hypothetical protein
MHVCYRNLLKIFCLFFVISFNSFEIGTRLFDTSLVFVVYIIFANGSFLNILQVTPARFKHCDL